MQRRSQDALSPTAFGLLTLLVTALVVAIPLIARRSALPPEEPAPVGPPPAAEEAQEEPERPPEPEVLRGAARYDADRGWLVVEQGSQKLIVPAGDLIGVVPAPGGQEELLLLEDGRRVAVPTGWVDELPRALRYRFDYGRSGNVDPDPEAELDRPR